jgi:hypothetical protein
MFYSVRVQNPDRVKQKKDAASIRAKEPRIVFFGKILESHIITAKINNKQFVIKR